MLNFVLLRQPTYYYFELITFQFVLEKIKIKLTAKWLFMNKNFVPNIWRAQAATPFVFICDRALTDKTPQSTVEHFDWRSCRIKMAKWIVPNLTACKRINFRPRHFCKVTSHSKIPSTNISYKKWPEVKNICFII